MVKGMLSEVIYLLRILNHAAYTPEWSQLFRWKGGGNIYSCSIITILMLFLHKLKKKKNSNHEF